MLTHNQSCYTRVYPLTLLLLLASTVCCISQKVYAQTGITDKDPENSSEKQPAKSEKHDKHLPVETGAGGNIRLERNYRAEAESQFDWHAHMLLESRYVSEGRDNLSGKGLISLSSEFIIDDVNFLPWVAHSPGADYTEINLNLIYATILADNLAASVGYNHIRIRQQDERATDNEISFDMGYKLLKQTALFVSAYHSFDANGAFIEAGTRYFDPLTKNFHYTVAISIGANAGYIPDGHKGVNHLQINADAAYVPVLHIEINAYAGYNQAINKDAIQYAGDETLGDFFWGGVGLNYLF